MQCNKKIKNQINNAKNTNCEGGLSKPKQNKSVIGLFRRESSTSGSVAGSDPCLAAQLAELAMTSTSDQPSAVASVSYSSTYRASVSGASSEHMFDRSSRGGRQRSISICAVTPIDENSENSVDPLGALIVLKHSDKYTKRENSYCKNNRRRSLFELSG